jgi:tRNA-dihydrouridine synthase
MNSALKTPLYILAPMDDVTDVVFRSIIADCAPPDMFFTEFVNVDGLQSPGRPKLIHKLAIDPRTDHSIVAQLWGKQPENYRQTADELVEMGFDGVDINMGCPQNVVVKNGCCSALINDRDKASQIVDAVKDGVSGRIPVSVKTRLGWNEIDLSWIEHLLGHDLDMLTVHLRTRKEMSEVPAHWDIAHEIVSMRDRISPKTLIIGNGDVRNRKHADELIALSGVDGVMIGRGVFKDPYCFSLDSPWSQMLPEQKVELYHRHITRFAHAYGEDTRKYQVLKKFSKVYINGFDHAADLREQINACENLAQMLELTEAAIKDSVNRT